MEGEDYCPILGMEESYAISSYGRIWDYRQKKWVETSINDLSLCLSGNHNSLCEEKASLVARHLNNPSFDTAILYKDGDHTNFELSNLEWCTLSMQSTIVKKSFIRTTTAKAWASTKHKAETTLRSFITVA